MWQMLIRMVMMMGMQPQQQQPINVNVDLSAIRDILGKRGFIQGGEPPDPEPMPVNVMNAPMPYTSGN